VKAKRGTGLVVSLSLVFAGAMGNIIDSAFYGLIFNASTPFQKAVLFPSGDGYAPFLHGAVVDMFYFPLVHGYFPAWLPVWGGQEFEFFRPVFNIADAAISVGVVMLILVQQLEERRSRRQHRTGPEQVPGTGQEHV
jgi:signal peptidase II